MDAFSLITVNSKGKDVPSFCHIQLVDTVLYDLQDGLKIVLPVLSRGALVEIVRCHIELFPRDNDRPSHAFSQVGGKAMVRVLMIWMNGIGDSHMLEFLGAIRLHSVIILVVNNCHVTDFAQFRSQHEHGCQRLLSARDEEREVDPKPGGDAVRAE